MPKNKDRKLSSIPEMYYELLLKELDKFLIYDIEDYSGIHIF